MVLARGTAYADDADDLVAKGELLAKQGEWTQAITAFKAADALRPRAQHACLIGLAYTRRELWPQAEVFFDRCRARATDADPLPSWLPDAERALADKLAASNAVALTISVEPADAGATLTVSSFAPDETFGARTLHLSPGTYTVTASAPEHRAVTQTIVLDGRTRTERLELRLVPTVVPPPPPPPPTTMTASAPRRSVVPTIVIGAGAAIGVAGVVHHLAVTRPSRSKAAESRSGYDRYIDDFRGDRNLTIALYATAGVVAATGLVLRYTVFREREAPAQVGAHLVDDGAMVTIGWSR